MTTTNETLTTFQSRATIQHQHLWEVVSSHQTSTGITQYLKCRACKTHQMRQLGFGHGTTMSSKELRAQEQ
ncbi:hypothetical protein [Glutamicibacter sp. JC586]|uniref:hypothetical protein n=1 Tax=Glutamicibacter sp. JC586 TaxID=2590552 RepID=UPI001359676F|nr:hypothetical protein [Glutamicibacter sp. JC586]